MKCCVLPRTPDKGESGKPMKILVIGPSWVGDMVMAQSLFITLQQQHPGCEIQVLAPAWCEDLLRFMPQVSGAIDMPVGHSELALGKRRALANKLRQENFDQAIVLPNSFKSALIPRFAGIPVRTGWRGEARGWLLNDCRRLDKHRYPLMIERFIALGLEPGATLPVPLPHPALSVDAHDAETLTRDMSLNTSMLTLVLCPGAEFGEAKKWPAEHYAAVAAAWLEKEGQVWIMGSTNDSPVAEQILKGLESELHRHCVNLCGRTTLAQAIILMARADQVVSNDSGLMHIAAALSRPLTVIYGSTSPGFTPPLSDKVSVVSLELECSPCFKRTCPLGHGNCLKQLSPGLVFDAMGKLGAP
jgi:heptosyltransferase-2